MRRIIAIIAGIATVISFSYLAAWGSSTGTTNHTGGCNGKDCHTPSALEATATVSGPDTITAGANAVYTVTVGSSSTETIGAGLDVEVSSGHLEPADNTRLQNGEIIHSTDTATSFSFTLTAPHALGDIAISGAALAANLDGTAAGDGFVTLFKAVAVVAPITSDPPTTTTTLPPTTTTTSGSSGQSPTSTLWVGPPANTPITEGPPNTTTTTTKPAPKPVEFKDVPESAWFYSFVTQLASNGVIGGYMDGSFKPNGLVTRAELAKMICLKMGWTPESPVKQSFSDVTPDDWEYQYIEAAKSHGAISGYPGSTFRPNNKITRAEIAAMLGKALFVASSPSNLRDASASWAKDYINGCSWLGVVQGYSDGSFKPSRPATRAETTKMLCSMVYRFEVTSAKVEGDRVTINLTVNGTQRIFSMYTHNADGKLRTNRQLIDRFKAFSIERLREWGAKPNGTEADVSFVGLSKLESLKLGG